VAELDLSKAGVV